MRTHTRSLLLVPSAARSCGRNSANSARPRRLYVPRFHIISLLRSASVVLIRCCPLSLLEFSPQPLALRPPRRAALRPAAPRGTCDSFIGIVLFRAILLRLDKSFIDSGTLFAPLRLAFIIILFLGAYFTANEQLVDFDTCLIFLRGNQSTKVLVLRSQSTQSVLAER